MGSPHSQCIPIVKALGRIRTSNHQIRSLALWSIELRGRVSCTCEWRMRASNPPVVPGANRVTTPSSPIPQAQRYRQRESNPHGEAPLVSETSASTHSAMPVCGETSLAARGWRESNSRPTARQADALPLSHTPKGVTRWGARRSNPRLPGFNRALGPSQLPPHGVGVTYQLLRGSGEAPDGIEPSSSRVATCYLSHSVTAP